MKFLLATPERKLIDSVDVIKLVVPTLDGEITVLPNHAPLLCSMGHGGVRIFYSPDLSRQEETIFVSDGIIEVIDDNVTLLAGMAELSHEIKEAELEESIRRSRERAKENLARVEVADIEARIARDLAKLKLVTKLSRKP
jgi:F-type H+-transporting ATPase subunit epsilon